MKKNKELWFTEKFTPHEIHQHGIRRFLVRKKTNFQEAVIADSYSFGRCLILDGEMQSAALDEFIYHEALIHPALISHPSPEEVLIMGGGEGATLREVLKYPGVKRITMVDIDAEVVKFCQRYLRRWHRGSLSDPRVRLLITDARRFVIDSGEKFDIIVSDLPSPIEGGPAYLLYTVEFYHRLVRALRPGGIFVAQACSGNLLQIRLHTTIYRTLTSVFPIVRPYYQYVPSFDLPWAFVFCSFKYDPRNLTARMVDTRLHKQVVGKLFFYDGETHQSLFSIPLYIRNLLKNETRIFTAKRPLYFYK